MKSKVWIKMGWKPWILQQLSLWLAKATAYLFWVKKNKTVAIDTLSNATNYNGLLSLLYLLISDWAMGPMAFYNFGQYILLEN
jgi:hypothetical protein